MRGGVVGIHPDTLLCPVHRLLVAPGGEMSERHVSEPLRLLRVPRIQAQGFLHVRDCLFRPSHTRKLAT